MKAPAEGSAPTFTEIIEKAKAVFQGGVGASGKDPVPETTEAELESVIGEQLESEARPLADPESQFEDVQLAMRKQLAQTIQEQKIEVLEAGMEVCACGV